MMPRISLLRLAASFSLLFSAGLSKTNAALIIYEPFNQSVGAMTGTSSSGGSPAAIWPTIGQNWSTPTGTSQILSGSLTGSVLTQGNRAQLGAETGASIFRDFGVTLGGPGTDLWLSFLISGQSAKQSQVLSLYNGATEQLAIGVNASIVYGLSVRSGGATTATGNPAVSTSIAPNNSTHFVAVHLELVGVGNSTFTVYVDPDLASFEGAGPTGGQSGFYTGVGSQPFSFNRIRLGEFSSATTSFDEFRVGDSWADVSPVPEPSCAGLLLLGSLGFAARRRRGMARAF